MRLRIHRGAAEIGGNCIEVQSAGKSLLLDLGQPLQSQSTMPLAPGLAAPDPSLLGVVLSHPHLDHYGLLLRARPDLSVWLGAGAIKLLEAAAPFTASSALPQTVTAYRTGVEFRVGPFKITPYLMDHSAYDAHALLVEADGKRLFYSGDFRGHGRKAGVFERFLASPPGDIDVLLMEGTTIGRVGDRSTETDVEDQSCTLMRAHEGLALLVFSAQNIDRFVTFLRASIRSDRVMVIDAYMANLIEALQLKSLPDARSNPNLRVFLPKTQKRMIVANHRFDLIDGFRSKRIHREEILAAPGRFAMMFRASMIPDFAGAALGGGCLIYSLWPGYLERDRTDLRVWARDRQIAFHIVHSSGHADLCDLQRMAAALQPKRLVPIHSAHAERFADLFANVNPAADGVWIDL